MPKTLEERVACIERALVSLSNIFQILLKDEEMQESKDPELAAIMDSAKNFTELVKSIEA